MIPSVAVKESAAETSNTEYGESITMTSMEKNNERNAFVLRPKSSPANTVKHIIHALIVEIENPVNAV